MFFGTARQKDSTKNRDIILLSIDYFDTRNQWHHRGFPWEFFRHCETKCFREKILKLPPRLSRPQTYSLPETFRNAAHNGSPAMFFGTARQKNSTKNRDLKLLSMKFFDTRNQWNTEVFPYEIFRYCETEQYRQKIVQPVPSLIPNIIRYQKLSETPKSSSTKLFGTVRQNSFNGKSWHNPLNYNFFRYPKSMTS